MSGKSRNTVIRIVLLIMLALVVCLVSYAEEQAAEEAVPAEEATEATPAEQPAVLLATIDGEEIWSDNELLKSAYDYYTELAESYGYDLENQDILSLVRQSAMYQPIQRKLVTEKAAELGLDSVTDEEKENFRTAAKEEWDEAVEYFVSQMGEVTEDATDEQKAAARADALAFIQEYYGFNEETYLAEVVNSQITTLISDRVKASVVNGESVTDEEIQQYFEDLVKEDREQYEKDVATYEFYTKYYGQSSYYQPEGYRGIVHILLPVDEALLNDWKDLAARFEEQQSKTEEETTEDAGTSAAEAEPTDTPEPTAEPVTKEQVDAAKQAILDSVQDKIDEMKAKLESGTSFEDLIKEYGTDPGMLDDTTRAEGYPVHNDSIVYDSAFQAAAMALEKIGDISEPVVGQYGVHILQYLRDIPGGAVELTDTMKEEFRSTLQSELENDLFSQALTEWALNADITYTAEGEAWKIDFESETEDEPAEEAAPAEAE